MTQNECFKVLALIYFCGSGKRLQQTGCHITSGTLESVTSQDNFRKYRVQFKSIVQDKYQLPFDCDAILLLNLQTQLKRRRRGDISIMIIWGTVPCLIH